MQKTRNTEIKMEIKLELEEDGKNEYKKEH